MIITVVRKSEIGGYVPSRDAAILRIYDPIEDWEAESGRLADSGWGATLSLAFWDVGVQGMGVAEAAMTRLAGRWRKLALSLGERFFPMGDDVPWRPFLDADARDIARFADGLEAKGVRHLMVVCGNGRARSWTVAKWLSKRLSASLADSHGWQRESSAITKVLARVPAPRVKVASSALASIVAAE